MSDEPDNLEPAPANDDPLDLKKRVNGIVILVIICSVLWVLSKFGPAGANWISNQTQLLFGLTPTEPKTEEPVTPEKNNQPTGEIVAVPANPEVKSPPAPRATEEIKLSGNPKIDNARKQILDALGGPEKAVVKHIAISEDEQSMVAAVKMLNSENSSEMLEIYFDKDDFGRYVSTPESLVDREIKVWEEE